MRKLLTIIFAILGMIVGIIVAPYFNSIPFLSWLSIGGEFGMNNPLVLNLNFMQLTFGIWIKINIAGVLFALLFALIGHEILRKLKV